MKTKLLFSFTAAVVLSTSLTQAQTAADYIAQGRAYLAATNLLSANTSFSNAVVLSPTNATANVLYGSTRLLVWPSLPTGSNFLSRFGVPVAGRSIYHWTARLPQDTNGVPLAPQGVSAEEAAVMLRTNLLGVISAAEANMAQVLDTNFTLALTAAETQSTDVTLDFGDVLMLRAMLQGAEYFAYTVYSWNLDAQLSAVRALYTNNAINLQTLLSEYPSLLTFATTNDLGAARAAFTNAVARYVQASQWIRNRPTNITRLFNLDPDKLSAEQNFRFTLADLSSSLNGAVTLRADSAYTVFLAPLFAGTHTPRSFLPQTRGSGFVLGTFPDLTFGGTIFGVNAGDIETLWAKFMAPVPWIPGLSVPHVPFGFVVNTLKSRGYVVQISTNLLNWSDYSAFVSAGESYRFLDTQPQVPARRFYRVVDRPLAQLPPPPNDNFANSTALSGLGIVATGYNANATVEPGEPGYDAWNTVWYVWTAPTNGLIVISTDGSDSYQFASVYTGSVLTSLTPVPYATYPNQSYNGFSFEATAGTTYRIQVGGSPGAIQLAIGFPPNLIVTSPVDGTVSLVPTNFNINASAVAPNGGISEMSCQGDGNQLAGTTNNTLSVVWTNVGPGVHNIEVSATDGLGITTYDSITVTVRPLNDSFSNAIPVVGASVVVAGTNLGASQEPGEPDIAGNTGGASVWWSWVAPSSGAITISADLLSPYGYSQNALLGVYTGTMVSNLVLVADNTPFYGTRAAVTFVANAGVRYQIAVDGLYGEQGNITLRVTPGQPPTATIDSPTNGTTFVTTSTTNITILASATDVDGHVAQVDFFTDGGYSPIGTVTNNPYSMVWSKVGPGSYQLLARATDNAGLTTFSDPVFLTVIAPPPPNDNFANPTPLSGTNAITSGTNIGASRESGEPYHCGYYGGRSVWFAWTAPKSGTFAVSASTPTVYNPILGIYTGTQLAGLATVACAAGNSCQAQIIFSVSAGQTYDLALDDISGDGGSYTLTLSSW